MKAVPQSRYVVFFSLALGGCALDLASKHWVFAWLGDPGPMPRRVYWLWDGHFGLETSLNPGALFGFGQGFALVFAVISVFAAAAIFYWLFIVGVAESRWLNFALGCVTAGVLGNLYDRLSLHGLVWPPGYQVGGEPVAGQRAFAVRDWILWQVNNDLRWPNFNIADALLVTGAAMLFWHALRHPKSPSSLASNADANRE